MQTLGICEHAEAFAIGRQDLCGKFLIELFIVSAF
jgi:hypothetical protein